MNTLMVFYGISVFAKDGRREPDSDTRTVELQESSLSLLTQDQLREKVGVITLGDIEEGALFTVISTSPYMVGEGENMREDILARVV